MRAVIVIVALAAFQKVVDFGVNAATATASHEHHSHEERYYADVLDELEQEIGSGVHGQDEKEENAKTYKLHNKRRSQEELARSAEAAEQHATELEGFKKKVDSRRAERERRRAHDLLENIKDESELRQKFHERQKEKRIHLDKMHREVTEVLDAHHDGRMLLSDRELKEHTRKQASLEKKRRSLEKETPEKVSHDEEIIYLIEELKLSSSPKLMCIIFYQYIERMERHEEKMIEKMERKKKRHDERFSRRDEEL